MTKFGSSFITSLDIRIPLKQRWISALKDPAYLLLVAVLVSVFSYEMYLL